MPQIDYRIRLLGQSEIRGSEKAHGAWRLMRELHGNIEYVRATVKVDITDKEKIFMNGFQTWTYCPEYSRKDKIRSLRHLPKAGVKHFGLDHYGDNYFVPYPEKAGITHGESWCYFRHGEQYRLVGSLDERAGYTLFCYDANRGLLTIERDCQGLKVDGLFPALELFFAKGTEDEVFDAWFAVMGVKPRTDKKIAGYSSWYNRYEDISEASVRADLLGCSEVMRKSDLFQIDDGWESNVGDWLETDPVKFPHGLKGMVEDIHARGFTAGLWLAPFVCNKNSYIYKTHPEWLYKHKGRPWYCGSNWGGFYSLDIDHPEVQAYLRRAFKRVFDEWGFDLVKLDFLYGAAPFGSEKETRAGRMIRAMEFLREVCGDKLILGCGVPVMPAFGLVDYCRVSCDVSLDWNDTWLMQQIHRERVSTKQAIGNSIARRQLNGRAYLSDPDVFFLRDDNIKLSEEEKLTLAQVNSVFGGVLLCSDNMGSYDAKKKAIYAELLKNREAKNVRVDADKDGYLYVYYEVDGVHKMIKIEK